MNLLGHNGSWFQSEALSDHDEIGAYRAILFSLFRLAALSAASLILVSCATVVSNGSGDYDLYLLIGQSNMAGRGIVGETDRTPHERVVMLDEKGRWKAAVDPVHFDKPQIAGVGPGLSFGKAMAATDRYRIIGLIPAAVGGSPIAVWTPGAYYEQTGTYPYDDAIVRARTAMTKGTLKAILWHQGEADANQDGVLLYKDALANLAANIRRDLDAEEVPFIVAAIGEFQSTADPETIKINSILRNVTGFIRKSAFVSAEGLRDNGDGTHFSAESARELGERYAAAYLGMREIPGKQAD